MLDGILGFLLSKMDKWHRILTKNRCLWFGHSYKYLTQHTWNCRKCGKLKIICMFTEDEEYG